MLKLLVPLLFISSVAYANVPHHNVPIEHTNNLNPGKCSEGDSLKKEITDAGFEVFMGFRDQTKPNITRYIAYDWHTDHMAIYSVINNENNVPSKECLEFVGSAVGFNSEAFRHFVAKKLIDEKEHAFEEYGKQRDKYNKEHHEFGDHYEDNNKVNFND